MSAGRVDLISTHVQFDVDAGEQRAAADGAERGGQRDDVRNGRDEIPVVRRGGVEREAADGEIAVDENAAARRALNARVRRALRLPATGRGPYAPVRCVCS